MAIRTLTEDVNSFDIKLYQSMASQAAKYARENDTGALISKIPIAKGLEFNVNQYKKPLFEKSTGVSGGKPSLDKEMMTTEKDHVVYNLKNVNAYLYYDQEDMMEQGNYLAQMHNEQLEEWARQANMGIMKGVHKLGFDEDGLGQGAKLNWGILDQATMVLNLQGASSLLDAAGDFYKAMVNFLTAIPYAYRSGKIIQMGATPHLYDRANEALFTYNNGETEWEQFFRIHMKGASPMKVSEEFIWSDDLFLDTGALVGDAADAATHYDCADGSRNNAYAPESDTLGTHDRLFAVIMEPNVLERAYSRGFGLMGEAKNYIGGITQTWTIKEMGCVHRPLAVLFSEQISWA